MIQFADSTGYLRSLYERIRGPNGEIDNVMKVHSLRPHTMEGHWVLYKSVMHHADNTLPGWFHECMAVYVGLCNDCGYSVAHHFAGLKRLLKRRCRANAIYAALEARAPERVFSGKELALLRYVRKLTQAPQFVVQDDIRAAREAGAEDGEILEATRSAPISTTRTGCSMALAYRARAKFSACRRPRAPIWQLAAHR